MTQQLSKDSWEDIYNVYFETRCQPSTWPMEGIVVALHHMMYLDPKDIYIGQAVSEEE